MDSLVPVVGYIVPETAVPVLPAPELEFIEPAPAVPYITPVPNVCRVLERRMNEGGGLEDREIFVAVCELAEQIVTKLQSDDRVGVLAYVEMRLFPGDSLGDSHCVAGMIFSEVTANRYLRLPSCLATGASVA